MKMPNDMYVELREGIRVVADHHGPKQLAELYRGKTLMVMMWSLLNMVMFDWKYDDDHPVFRSGRARILPYKDRYWDLYVCGLNDNHIETALKKIASELKLAPAK